PADDVQRGVDVATVERREGLHGGPDPFPTLDPPAIQEPEGTAERLLRVALPAHRGEVDPVVNGDAAPAPRRESFFDIALQEFAAVRGADAFERTVQGRRRDDATDQRTH